MWLLRETATLPSMSETNDIQTRAIELSELFATLVERAGRSVVQVAARRGIGSSGIVWSADGVIVAADHNIQREEDIQVGLPDGTTVPATLVGRDPSTDLAVLRVEVTGLQVPDWSDLADVRTGHIAFGLLRPGRSVRAVLGIVSAFGDEWRTPAGGRLDRFLQTDLAIQKGFSGSLVVDVRGRALGMGTAGLLRDHALAVPHATLTRVVDVILSHGRMPRGQIGVGLVPVRLPADVEAKTGQPTALMVALVQPGSPAEQAGLLLGDVVVSVDGQPAADLGQLHGLLSGDRIGTESVLRILRAGELRELRVTIGAR